MAPDGSIAYLAPDRFSILARRSARLGTLLCRRGHIDRPILRRALARRHASAAPLGRVLRAEGLIDPMALAQAVAAQWGLGVVDLRAHPSDPALLLSVDPGACLRHQCVPWRTLDGVVLLAVADPASADDAVAAAGLAGRPVAIAVAPAEAITASIEALFAAELEADARNTCPDHLSCRSMTGLARNRTFLALAALCAVLAVAAPAVLFWIAFGWIIVANAGICLLRLAAVIARFWPRSSPRPLPDTVPRLADFRKPPVVSLLIPLHGEDAVIPALMTHLRALDYPAECLDIRFLVETGDTTTTDAIAAADPAGLARVITVPPHRLRTKPRALNYGLSFARGEIVGILDAEDRPEPDQIRKVVDHLHAAPPTVACVQGMLDFYNTRRNWLSRCFAIEYAIWFRVLLTGMRRLNLPVPLGGTTVYFRRSVLERIGGWDAHNVTEDADLGMRIARMGLTCEILPSTTWEEANARALPWVRQRSRWLKGFVMTWLTHMRRPAELLRDLGPAGFLTFQAVFLAGATAYLSIPVLWAVWIAFLVGDPRPMLGGADALWTAAFVSMIVGQIVMISVACLATTRRGKWGLLPWVFTLPLYWPLGALAALKAAVELIVAPFYWDKTAHGAYS